LLFLIAILTLDDIVKRMERVNTYRMAGILTTQLARAAKLAHGTLGTRLKEDV
jgi:hypothetical protein